MVRRPTYPLDLTDDQWALIEPLLPPANTGGRPEKHPRRDVVDAILCVVCTGCSWRHLPVDFPPWQTVYWYFSRWEEAKVTEQVMAVLRRRVRTAQGRGASPRRGSSTPRAPKVPTPSVGPPGAMTPARRSTAARGSSSPTPWGWWCA